MDTIISKLYTLIHQSDNLIGFEESVRSMMYEAFASLLEGVFTNMNDVIVKQNRLRAGRWKGMTKGKFSFLLVW
ncbi:MAG TPA: hypothetical protein VK105_10975 [Virgibacillus sp.]|nr:hypothetical protein [Virgibacillus sp.]HLR67629.1 hypothetical protein [Virgibacillus sp.]